MSKIWHLWANHDANYDFDDHGDLFIFKPGMSNHSSLIPRSVRPSSLKWWSIKLATSVKSTFGNAILVWESLSGWVAVGHRVAVDVPKAINLYLHNDDISSKAEIKLSIISKISHNIKRWEWVVSNLDYLKWISIEQLSKRETSWKSHPWLPRLS